MNTKLDKKFQGIFYHLFFINSVMSPSFCCNNCSKVGLLSGPKEFLSTSTVAMYHCSCKCNADFYDRQVTTAGHQLFYSLH